MWSGVYYLGLTGIILVSPSTLDPGIWLLAPPAAQQKLEQAKANGAFMKNLEDMIYEIEDAIRLSSQTS